MARYAFVTATLFVSALSASAHAAFVINFNFADGTSDAAKQVYNNAAATWESVITGYKTGVTLTGVTINAGFSDLDTGILGQAGPNTITQRSNTWYTSTGTMTFNTDYYGTGGSSLNSGFSDVVLHEMGHVLGIGTLWTNNGLYVDGSGQYTGAAGLLAYNTEFGQTGTYVPVELGGGSGTADGHWNEVDGGGVNTGIVSLYNGRDFRYELMTGWADTPTFLSSLTRYSMVDLGYTVSPIPEPAALAVISLFAFGLRRRRA